MRRVAGILISFEKLTVSLSTQGLRDRVCIPVLSRTQTQGFPGGSEVKVSTCNAGDPGSIPGSGKSPGEGKGYPLQYSGLENSMDYIVLGVAKSWTRLNDFTTSQFI